MTDCRQSSSSLATHRSRRGVHRPFHAHSELHSSGSWSRRGGPQSTTSVLATAQSRQPVVKSSANTRATRVMAYPGLWRADGLRRGRPQRLPGLRLQHDLGPGPRRGLQGPRPKRLPDSTAHPSRRGLRAAMFSRRLRPRSAHAPPSFERAPAVVVTILGRLAVSWSCRGASILREDALAGRRALVGVDTTVCIAACSAHVLDERAQGKPVAVV